MDIKEMVVNQVITGMANILEQNQIEKLYGILTITLHEYDIMAQKYEVAEYDDYDRFLCEQYYAALKVEVYGAVASYDGVGSEAVKRNQLRGYTILPCTVSAKKKDSKQYARWNETLYLCVLLMGRICRLHR